MLAFMASPRIIGRSGEPKDHPRRTNVGSSGLPGLGATHACKIRAGELLADVEKNQGALPVKTGSKARPVLETLTEMAERKERRKGGDPKSQPVTLAKLPDLGVTKTQSSRDRSSRRRWGGDQGGRTS
jgi:hypothetical protein